MIIINSKVKIEDYQLRELETGLLLVCPKTLQLKYLYELPDETFFKMIDTGFVFIKEGLDFYIADVEETI